MSFVRLGAVAINQTPFDWEGNFERISAAVREAQKQKIQLLVLPELCITGYGCEDGFFSPDTWQHASEMLQKIVAISNNIAVAVGLPVYFQGSLYNCIAMIQNKKLVGINAKKNLPREGIHYEYRWFQPFRPGQASVIDFAGTQVPFGDLYYQFGSLNVGMEICEEAWGATSSTANVADRCHIILCPSASHFALGKYKTRETLVANASRALNVFYVYTNLLGCEAGRIIYDGGSLFAKNGKIVRRGPRFGFGDWNLTWEDCDLTLVEVTKSKSKSVAVDANRDATYEAKCVAAKPITPSKSKANAQTEVKFTDLDVNQEFLRAVELGLFDYLRKTASQGYVVSLSGGVDSAVCATLIASAFRHAWEELGAKEFSARTSIKSNGKDGIQDVLRKHLFCIYQSTKQSTAETFKLAAALARDIGCAFHSVDVDYIVQTYTGLAEGLEGRKLTWDQDDLTLQNIQARARAPMAWLLANIHNAILITTSNRSEGTTGYATMDGDMAGGLAPIAGIDKAFLRKWILWAANSKEVCGSKLKSLAAIATIPPTAELRPAEAKQEDEKDLMPYDVLARMEKLILRDRMRRSEALLQLRKEFPKRKNIDEDLEKFDRLFGRSQWKRDRMAPAFHIDDMSVDSRGWLRYPLLSK